jgi:hypothetical protein
MKESARQIPPGRTGNMTAGEKPEGENLLGKAVAETDSGFPVIIGHPDGGNKASAH